MNSSSCRFCGSSLHHTFVDLGMSPLCQTHITPEALNHMEPFYPLHTYVCENCFLVQLQEFVSPQDIFTEYAYFSSYVDALLKNASEYSDLMVERFKLGAHSQVIEIASNDGYLLQYFLKKGIPVLGVEPAVNVSQVAIDKGIPVVNKFFGQQTAIELAANGKADLLLGNNVLAHVPDINDFVSGMKVLLKADGVITMEFPHLMRLMAENQFDTIYHEHFSYLSFMVVQKIFAHHGLTLFDVQEIPIHGGSLRIYARHTEDSSKPVGDRVTELIAREAAAGFDKLETYAHFTEQVKETKRKLLEFLITAKQKGKTIAGYGAPGKGNTLLNYCGIRTDFLDYTVDRNPYKQGKFTPGTHIPILSPDRIKETKPDYLLILPWNVKDEIMEQTSYIREWGGQFVIPIPEVKIYS
ncbi:MAG: class I SAM-dependent methyltransferase [Leptolyngbyaceae cyanobacterium CSU_1_3]|nr:class I SAM-dependent methyltransferase [Leptolyngbyaceae cyanobacterium CSU_1_3]